MSGSLEGKSVIVTGADVGVGLAIARKCAENGARVMMTADREKKLRAECDVLTASGETAICFSGDLSQKLTVANLLSTTIDAHDRIDILINASRDMQKSDPLDPDNPVFESLMKTNVMNPLKLTQRVMRRAMQMQDDENGIPGLQSVVNVGSIAARRTLPELMAYSVASAALDQMTRSLAASLAAMGTRVNAIALGSVMSASLQNALQDQENLQQRIVAVTPLNRIGEADEAAEVAVFLASDAASFVTGQIIAVDGGRTILDPIQVPAH